MLPILRKTKRSVASDPRDLLFAKYGLIGKKAIALYAPEYTSPFDTVCRNFAWEYIRQEQDLSTFCYAGISSNERRASFPTWVPDWGPRRPAYPFTSSWSGEAEDWPTYQAAGNTIPSVHLLENGRVLEAEGVVFDTIDGVQFDPWCQRGVTSHHRSLRQ